jgi:type IV fimbrial biogenesis protein FimT
MRPIDPQQQGRAPVHRPRPALLALKAFTLVELMVGLAVAAILLGVAIPNFRTMLERHALRAAASDLLAALHFARAQALARGEIIVLAPQDPAGAWAGGWVVFADTDGDGMAGAGEELLFQRGAVADGLRIRSRLTVAAPPAYVAYNSAGRSCRAGNSLAPNWGTLALDLGDHRRNIIINMLGRARLCDPATESGCNTPAG